ncbi:MAG: hypothetical protein ACE3NC_00730, partial [Candidatus Wallacebacter cryptica]
PSTRKFQGTFDLTRASRDCSTDSPGDTEEKVILGVVSSIIKYGSTVKLTDTVWADMHPTAANRTKRDTTERVKQRKSDALILLTLLVYLSLGCGLFNYTINRFICQFHFKKSKQVLSLACF